MAAQPFFKKKQQKVHVLFFYNTIREFTYSIYHGNRLRSRFVFFNRVLSFNEHTFLYLQKRKALLKFFFSCIRFFDLNTFTRIFSIPTNT